MARSLRLMVAPAVYDSPRVEMEDCMESAMGSPTCAKAA